MALRLFLLRSVVRIPEKINHRDTEFTEKQLNEKLTICDWSFFFLCALCVSVVNPIPLKSEQAEVRTLQCSVHSEARDGYNSNENAPG